MEKPEPQQIEWIRVGNSDMLEGGRITTVQVGHYTIALTRTEEGYGAISNRCPHQGGPLGDGFLQNGYVVCPWHAYEYHPCTGAPPGGYDDSVPAYPVEERQDGLYVGVPPVAHEPTLMDQMVDIMTDWEVDTVFGMVGHLIFPDEIQTMPALENSAPRPQDGRIAHPQISPPAADLEKAVAMLEQAERPGIIIGNGARPFADQIITLAEKLDAPIITTFKAKGAIPDSHPLACGVLGRSGTPVASATMMRSDLLLVLGASFSNHTSITTKRPVIQVDFDRMMLGKFHEVTLPLWGEIGTVADLLLARLTPKARSERREYVARLWRNWRAEKEKRANTPSQDGRVANAAIFQIMSDITPADAVIAVDVGNNAYAFGMYFEAQRQHVLMSGYLGSIGFAFPAAMGAWAAAPQRKVIAVAGDGGFGQYMAEFTTAVKYNMNITLVLLNNSELAKISREQRGGNFHVWQTDLHNPDFARYAENCGGLGLRVTHIEQLQPALEQAFAHDGPSLVEIISAADQL